MGTIAEWLASLGLSEYAQRFAENDIDLSVLGDLTDQHLKDLGVSLGHRLRMLRAIRELADASPATPPPAAASKPTPHDSAERRQLTVMFCDLVGSTALSTRLDPEDLQGIIGAYHRCCAEVITKSGGFVARYLGDGVLAYFGYPQAHEDDAEEAVRAGLALVEVVAKLDAGQATPLQMRVGIGTGLVVVGDLIGGDATHKNEVVGETPNFAARIQALAEPDTVVIDGNTRRLLGGLFEYRPLGPVCVKGFRDPVLIWQVTGNSAVESRFKALRATTTPLVGREEEIDLLLRRWQQAKAGDGCVVLITGEPGIGKSRLAHTLLEQLRDETHVRLRYFLSVCSPHHQDTPFYPIITQLERAARFRREDTVEQRLDKLEALLARTHGDLNLVVPLFAALLSIPTGERYPRPDLSPQKQKQQTFDAMLALVEGLATQQPALMMHEDLQWSDATTLELLDLLVDRVPGLPVLLIATFRPEFAPRWLHRPHVTLLSLGRLPPHQRAEMITRVAAGRTLPKEVEDEIIDRTDGIPLFVEEMTKAVIESGVLTDVGGCFTMAKPMPALAIPTTLIASLLARLDRSAPMRQVAQIGAALGREFSYELISAVAPMPQESLDDALTQLMNSELVFRRGNPPGAEYSFKHALVQDAAYSTLLHSRRRQLHARITAILEGQFPEIVEGQPELLARHCAEAGLVEKAVGYCLKAGQQAVARGALAEAVAQFQKGLDVLANLPESAWRAQQELDLLIALRPALGATKGYSAPDVGETIVRARALAEQIGRADYLARLIFGQWTFHLNRAEHKLALSFAEQFEKIGEERNDVAAQLQGRRAKGLTRLLLGEFVVARTLLEQCRRLGDPAHRAVGGGPAGDSYILTLAHLAVTLAQLGYIDQARSQLNEAMSEARRLSHAHTLAAVLLSATWIDSITRSPEMLCHAEELLALSDEHGFPYFSGVATAFRGASLVVLEQAQPGLTLVTRGLTAMRATGTDQNTAHCLIWCAEAYAMLGRPAEGLNCLAEAARMIETTEERYHEAELHRLRGELLNATGDTSAAERSHHQALAVAQRQSAKVFELRAATSLARLWRDQGKRTEARDLLAPVYAWFTEGFDTPVLQDAKALLDQVA